MQAVGIIAEYNPFHNGHEWHLQEARRRSGRTAAVCVMSGQFVQRGEPAFFDKWQRAHMAVAGGADLVLELPAVFAVRSAQYFAAGGIRLLAALGVVREVCFGAEHADLAALQAAASALAAEAVQISLRQKMQTGMTYAAALGGSLAEQCSLPAQMIAAANNILAIEYLRAIGEFAPQLVPLPVTRQQAGYHDTELTVPFASATAVRRYLLRQGAVDSQAAAVLPKKAAAVIERALEESGPVVLQDFSSIILARLRTASIAELEKLPSAGEGLAHKLRSAALQAADIQELLTLMKSRRYSQTRLQRLLIHTLLGLDGNVLSEADAAGPLYARVLAFNECGRQLLKVLQHTSTVPLITKTAVWLNSRQQGLAQLTPLQRMLAVDTVASDLYALARPAPWRKGGRDFTTSPLFLPAKPATV